MLAINYEERYSDDEDPFVRDLTATSDCAHTPPRCWGGRRSGEMRGFIICYSRFQSFSDSHLVDINIQRQKTSTYFTKLHKIALSSEHQPALSISTDTNRCNFSIWDKQNRNRTFWVFFTFQNRNADIWIWHGNLTIYLTVIIVLFPKVCDLSNLSRKVILSGNKVSQKLYYLKWRSRKVILSG